MTRPDRGDIERDARAVMMVGLPGRQLDTATAAHLYGGGVGIIIFQKNITTASQVRALTSAASCAAGGSILVSVDQEIGRVARLGGLVTATPSTAELASMTNGEIEAIAARLGAEMNRLGVNLNLAPVSDVVRGANPVLRGRNLGDNADNVARVVGAYIAGLQTQAVAATAKHFPGHGLSRTDPHTRVTTIDAPLFDLEAVDFRPFVAAIAEGVRAVMVGHPIYGALDAELPASISPATIGLLRDMGFDGVAMTDALSMRGLTGSIPAGEAAVLALAAGEDLLLVDHWQSVDEVLEALVAAVEAGSLSRDRLTEAAQRVRSLAQWVVSPPCVGPR